MNELTEVQTILDAKGHAAFAVIPYSEYEALLSHARLQTRRKETTLPHEVVGLMVDDLSPARAWREHMGLTQAEVAARMRISQAALAQIESAQSPRKATRIKLAAALGIKAEQLL